MNKRIWIIDFLRGIAILMVVAFHIVFDLNFFFDVPVTYWEGFWFYEGRLSALLFMGMVGVVSAIINQQNPPQKSLKINLKRGLRLLGIGMLITLGTALVLPHVMIWFGILHLMGFSILFSLPFLRYKWLNIILGAAVISLSVFVEGKTVSTYALLPFGIAPEVFSSLDYYPLIPWMGVILTGVGLGNLFYDLLATLPSPTPWQEKFVWLGKNSLWIYLVHQPIFVGIFWLIMKLI